MNDIEIINQVIYTEQGKKMNYIDIDNIIDNECENFIQAIENLIKRNKDLEEIEREHKEENGSLREENKNLEKELEEKDMQHELELIGKEEFTKANMAEIIEHYYTANEDCIPISKFKKKIEELNKEEKKSLKGTKGQDRYSIKLEYMHKRNALQELLEESD